MRIGVLNGPNLQRLGSREPEHYGTRTLPEIEEMLRARASQADAEIFFFQSNHEGELIDWIEEHAGSLDGFVVNAGALTHGSWPLRDALVGAERPFVEVHLSNIFAREPFRRDSVLASRAIGVVAGFRELSYVLGLEALVAHLES